MKQLLLLLVLLLPSLGFAADTAPTELLDTCTQGAYFDYDNNPVNEAQDLLQTVIEEIERAVDTASIRLFYAFINNPGYGIAISAAFTLVLIFFAVSFMFGFVTMTLGQAVIRMVKIAIVAWVASPIFGWVFIQDYFGQFFNDGGAWLINAMINIATTGDIYDLGGNPPSDDVTKPFLILDEIIKVVFSPRMFVTIIGAVSAGPFGILMAGALVWAVISIFMALLKALQIYAISIVLKAVLIGLSPVFIPMFLFERTKQMFMGWINQLVNFTLQPILLFAFLAFFATLVASAARDIIPPNDVHLCYVKAENQAATPMDMHNWKFMCCDEGGGNCLPFEGKHTWEGPIDCPDSPIFPVNHINVLVFLLLTHIMSQLTGVAVAIAAELSSGMMRLSDIQNSVNDWFKGVGGGGGGNAQFIRHAGRAR